MSATEKVSTRDASRESRTSSDRPVTENRERTDRERLAEMLELFRGQTGNSALPDIPKIEGFHVCWLTTTNPRDPIHGRMRMGYTPIRADEVPGLEQLTTKTGEFAGCIAVNEMLAFKLPEDIYQMYMRESHHDAPLREQERLNVALDTIRESAEQNKTRIYEEEGQAQLRESLRVPAPNFE
jgi:hypothetical protein